MSDSFPLNIPSDDAALMADDNSSGSEAPLPWHDSNGDDDDDTEDPTGGKGKKHPSSVFMWNIPKEPVVKTKVRGGAFPTTKFAKTPGYKRVP